MKQNLSWLAVVVNRVEISHLYIRQVVRDVERVAASILLVVVYREQI